MLEVIGAGFGRTGTKSVKASLEILGLGPCHHMHELAEHPESICWWKKLADGEPADWEQAFKGYRSQVDWPGAFFWREICETYPDAKVLLTVRDPQDWYDSFCRTIAKSIAFPEMSKTPELREMRRVAQKVILEGVFEGNIDNKGAMIARFNRHNDDVIATIDPERLLVYNVAEGWGPLCRFLGKDIPSVDFPAANSSPEFWQYKPA